MSVPLFATRPVLEPLLDEVAARQEAVLRSGRYILGPEVDGFEAEFAAYLGTRHCVGVANGTDALTIALRALGVGSGDEVVVPALTFYATAEAVVNAGATPVFCDVDAATFTITAATVEPALSPRTKAIVPVHLYGNPAPMAELRELAAAHGLRVLEDAAQAAGA
jgi:dTDP-4-amino-4,6-dideoxygalactose transaminase